MYGRDQVSGRACGAAVPSPVNKAHDRFVADVACMTVAAQYLDGEITQILTAVVMRTDGEGIGAHSLIGKAAKSLCQVPIPMRRCGPSPGPNEPSGPGRDGNAFRDCRQKGAGSDCAERCGTVGGFEGGGEKVVGHTGSTT
jgi:hypothetical protein